MNKDRNKMFTLQKIISILDTLSMDTQLDFANSLMNLGKDIYLNGLSDVNPSLGTMSVINYIHDTIGLVLSSGLDDLPIIKENLIQHFLDIDNSDVPVARKDNFMTEANITLYNPTFDPGNDTAVCVEIGNKIAGITFSAKGIQSLLAESNLYATQDNIIDTVIGSGVILAGDSDEVFTPKEYAEALEVHYSNKLDEPIYKNTSITYRRMIEGYKNMKPMIKSANEDRFKNRTDSELRRMLLDVWTASNRPAEFERDNMPYMTREEVIEAIEAQERQPVNTKAAVDDIIQSYVGLTAEDIIDYTIKRSYDDTELGMEETIGLQDDYSFATDLATGEDAKLLDSDGVPVPVTISGIKEALSVDDVVETFDGSIKIEATEDGYLVVAITESDYVEEFFSNTELDDAIEFFMEQLTTETLSVEGSLETHAASGEITDLSVPTKEEFEEAKQILAMEEEKRLQFSTLLDAYTQKLMNELGMTPDSDMQYKRALEIVLRKIRNFKRSIVKLSDTRYAEIASQISGGTASIAKFRTVVKEHFDAEMSVIKELEKKAKTPEWGKTFLKIKDIEKGTEQGHPEVYIKDEDLPNKQSADARIQELLDVSNMLDEILQMETQLNEDLHNISTIV